MRRKYAIMGLVAAIAMLSSIAIVSAQGDDGLVRRHSNTIFWFDFYDVDGVPIPVSEVETVDSMTYEYYVGTIKFFGPVLIKDWYVKDGRLYVHVDSTTKPHPPNDATNSIVVIYGTFYGGVGWSVTGPGFRRRSGGW